MTGRRSARPRPPLDRSSLEELAIRYVGRFATTRSKLRFYLSRKLRERGWEGSAGPDLEGIADRFSSLGYIDDQGFAMAKSRSLTNRGYGSARVRQSLYAAGIGEEDSQAAIAKATADATESALRFARRRRIGPFAPEDADPRDREKAIAAMIRAGHSFEISRKIVNLPPGSDVQPSDVSGKET